VNGDLPFQITLEGGADLKFSTGKSHNQRLQRRFQTHHISQQGDWWITAH
jgi:hypothetical protein